MPVRNTPNGVALGRDQWPRRDDLLHNAQKDATLGKITSGRQIGKLGYWDKALISNWLFGRISPWSMPRNIYYWYPLAMKHGWLENPELNGGVMNGKSLFQVWWVVPCPLLSLIFFDYPVVEVSSSARTFSGQQIHRPSILKAAMTGPRANPARCGELVGEIWWNLVKSISQKLQQK